MKNLVKGIDNGTLSTQAFKNVLLSYERQLAQEEDINKICDLLASIEFVKAFISYSEKNKSKLWSDGSSF